MFAFQALKLPKIGINTENYQKMAINGKIAINGKMAINGQNGRILYARYDSNNILSQNRTFWEKGNYIGNLCFCCNISITMKMKKNKMA